MLVQIDAQPPRLGWAKQLFLALMPEGEASPRPVQAPGQSIVAQTAPGIGTFTLHFLVSHPDGDLCGGTGKEKFKKNPKLKLCSHQASQSSCSWGTWATTCTTRTTRTNDASPFSHDNWPSGQSTPLPSSKGSLPEALCREPASRSGSVQGGLVGSGSRPAMWLYDFHLTAANGDTPCWDPWWVQSELKWKEEFWVKILAVPIYSVFILWNMMDLHFSNSSLVFGCGLTRPTVVTGDAKRTNIHVSNQRSKIISAAFVHQVFSVLYLEV